MRQPTLVRLRRNDPDIIGNRSCDPFQDGKAFRVDTVIVGQENAHNYMSPSLSPLLEGVYSYTLSILANSRSALVASRSIFFRPPM
ncbi:hypothetical protein D3C71_397870 [compost metagenome]